MNILKNEILNNKKLFFYYLVICVVLLGAGLAKGTGVVVESGPDISQFIEAMPASLMAVFGMVGVDMTTIAGFYGIIFIYVSLTTYFFAGNLGSQIFYREETEHTSEFLYAKPISRVKIYFIKVLALIIVLFLFDIVCALISHLTIFYVLDYNILPLIISSTTAMFLVQLTVGLFGVMMASILKKSKRAGGIASIIVITSYLLGTVIDIVGNLEYFEYFLITRYLDIPNMVLTNGGWHFGFMTLNCVLLLMFMVVGCLSIKRRDINI